MDQYNHSYHDKVLRQARRSEREKRRANERMDLFLFCWLIFWVAVFPTALALIIANAGTIQ